LSGRLPSRPFCHRRRKVRGESSPLQKPSFRRSGFRRDPLHHRGPEVWVCRGGFRRDPFAIEDGKFGAKAPLYKNRLFVGAASAATLCVIEHRRFGFVGAASVATLALLKAESSGRKPLLQKPSFRRSGFSRDPLRHREPEVRVCRGGFRRDPFAIQGRGLGDGMEDNGGQLPCLNLWCNEGREVASAPL
jgi:hypothetical protein